MGKLTEALAHLRATTDRAIEFADPARAIAEAGDKFKAEIATAFDDLVERVEKKEAAQIAALTAFETPPPPSNPAPPPPAPETAAPAAPVASLNAAPTGEEIAAAALAAASSQAS